jgi:HK97 family phage major capsid protein
MDKALKEALDDLGTNFANGLNAAAKQVDEIDQRMEQLELQIARKGVPGIGDEGNSESRAQRKVFAQFLRGGPESVDAGDRRNVLTIADDTGGGYLAPVDFVTEILRNVVQFSPVRQAARIAQTSRGEVQLPKRTGTLTGKWVGEIEQRSESAPSYGQLSIPISEAACYVDVSNAMLEDAAVDFAAELAFDLAEEFGRLESQAFVNGQSNKSPAGFMADPAIALTASGSATDLTADGLIDALYSLAPFYRNRSSWMMNGVTLGKVRKLKDLQGQYLWSPGLAGQPETLLSRPVFEAIDMPDTGAGAFPIAVGDFNQGYRIYDRVTLAIIRDPYSLATSGQTRFHARRRVGGGVAKAEAIRKIKCAAS